jgi:hypothetical protein
MASPPSGTQTVAFVSATPVTKGLEAFVVDQSTLTMYRLEGTNAWVKREVMHVQIPYNSSS